MGLLDGVMNVFKLKDDDYDDEYGYDDYDDDFEDDDDKASARKRLFPSAKKSSIEEDDDDIYTTVSEMPAKSRILFAEDGTEKIISIDATLKRYGQLTAGQLVDITHRKSTPWTMTKKSTWIVYSEIKPETIKNYHKFEKI